MVLVFLNSLCRQPVGLTLKTVENQIILILTVDHKINS